MEIEHVAYNVSDSIGLAAWYGKHLGMRVVRKIDEAPYTHFIADGTGRVVLEVYQHPKAELPNYGAFDPLTLHIAFKVSDVASERDRLLAAGAARPTDITVTPAGDEMVFLRDPWGITIQLIKRRQPLL